MMTMDKREIRNQMRVLRKVLTPEEKARASAALCAKLQKHLPPAHGTLAVYLASPDEIDLAPLIRHALANGITVVAPQWKGATYALARLKSLRPQDLRKGPMGILEPAVDDGVAPQEVDVWLVPGLAFTRDGRRLGYGGGWYDRLMAGARKDAAKIGVAHAFQIVSALPLEPHDILLTDVVDDQ